jgi:lipopolysaccharide heptosyltransferase II
LEESLMERILIRSSNWLGDAVMSVPAVRSIKLGHPGSHLTILTPEKLAEVWKLVAEVDEVIAIPQVTGSGLKRKFSSMLNVFSVGRLVRGRGFGMAVVFPNSLRTGLEMWLARIPRRAGYPGHAPRSLLLNRVLAAAKSAGEPVGPGVHQVHHYLALAEFVGGRVISDPKFGFPDPVGKKAVSSGNPTRIAICAGAEYGPAKRWLPERYAEVVKQVSTSVACHWQLVGTAKDRDVAQTISSLAGDAANIENLCGQTSLAGLITILRESDLLLTNDTGTMHLGTLLGVPVIAIFGSTEPVLTGPLGSGHTILRKQVDCSPCFLRECPIDFRCMKAIEVPEVIAAIRAASGASREK